MVQRWHFVEPSDKETNHQLQKAKENFYEEISKTVNLLLWSLFKSLSNHFLLLIQTWKVTR